MSQITTLQPTGLPGKLRTFIAKTLWVAVPETLLLLKVYEINSIFDTTPNTICLSIPEQKSVVVILPYTKRINI